MKNIFSMKFLAFLGLLIWELSHWDHQSIVLPIPGETLSYLQENGTLVLPEENFSKTTESGDSNDNWEDDCQDNVAVAVAPNLDKFSDEILKAIKVLGGSAFPKLNWSSPKDATWISFNRSLRCFTPGDVYLLLKSSDFVSHDLTCPFKDCIDNTIAEEKVDYCLVLRKWVEINPSDEFRCFVKNKELIGVSQRDISQHYSSVHKEKDCILDDIMIFWEENVRNYLPLFSYVFDVHRPKDGQVTLIDFGPFGPTTDGLMFSWDELYGKEDKTETSCIQNEFRHLSEQLQSDENEPEFRYIVNATGVQPSPYSRYGLPVDIVDLSSSRNPFKLIDFLQMKIQAEDGGCSNSDDESEQEASSLENSSSVI